MLNREQLLAKGLSPDEADEIISATESAGDPIQELEKALKGKGDDSVDSLFKAEDEKGDHKEPDADNKGGKSDDDDDNEQPDEEYMRKHMKKFMAKNKQECAKAAEEAGLFEKKMNKAIDSFDRSAEGAVVEMTDLAPFLSHQSEFNASMMKAISFIAGKIDLITGQNAESYDLLAKAASVDLAIARSIDLVSAQPSGRKGVTAMSQDMNKASSVNAGSADEAKLIYRTLSKAMLLKDRTASDILSVFESSGKNVRALTPSQMSYVKELISKTEGN